MHFPNVEVVLKLDELFIQCGRWYLYSKVLIYSGNKTVCQQLGWGFERFVCYRLSACTI